MYEFLDAGALCGACEEHCESCSKLKSPSAVLTSLLVVDVAPAVQKALEHPPNPCGNTLPASLRIETATCQFSSEASHDFSVTVWFRSSSLIM